MGDHHRSHLITHNRCSASPNHATAGSLGRGQPSRPPAAHLWVPTMVQTWVGKPTSRVSSCSGLGMSHSVRWSTGYSSFAQGEEIAEQKTCSRYYCRAQLKMKMRRFLPELASESSA